jgi:hypothetical protein
MPLGKGYSHAAFEADYAEMRRGGHSHEQSLAAAYANVRKNYWKRFPDGAVPAWMVRPGESRLNPDRNKTKKTARRKNPCGCAPRKQNPDGLFALELKVDTDRKWHKVVTSHAMMPASEISAYLHMFAAERQMSPGFIDARVIDRADNVVWERKSNRSENSPKRKPNPVPPSKHVQRRDAADLYQRFTGHEALDEVVVDKPELPDVMLVVGDIDGIMYTTVRDGVEEKYVHQFKKKARPLFCVSPDGTQIHLMGGEYDFTERGIVDRT